MFYVFHGEDSYSQRETLAAQITRLGDPSMLELNTTRFNAPVTFSELQQACAVVPFLAQARVVIVQDLFASNPDKGFMDRLEAYLPQLPETTRLVFLESKPLADSHRIVRLAQQQKNGFVRRFDRPVGVGLERWISQKAADKGSRISPQAAQLLATNIGPDLQVLENEIEKLALYKGEGATVEIEDVVLLSPYAAEASIFDLVDALGGRQGAQAAALLQQKLNEGADPFYLFTMFVRQFRLLIQTKELIEQGERAPGVAARLNVRPFVAEKLARQARGFTVEQLEHIYRRLLQIDVETKTGQADLLTALHLLVAGLTAETV